MRICIPVNDDQGLSSEVCAHFGSAPAFLIVDTDSNACRAIANRNQHHGHGMCSPLASTQGEVHRRIRIPTCPHAGCGTILAA